MNKNVVEKNELIAQMIEDLSHKIINAEDKFHVLEELIILPLEKTKYNFSFNENDVKRELLITLNKNNNIKPLDFEYFSYMLNIIGINYSNLGKALTIKKIKSDEIYLAIDPIAASLEADKLLISKYHEFEKQLLYTIIYVLKNKNFIGKETDDNRLIKFYILEINKDYFNDVEFNKMENAIVSNDFSNLDIYENNETPRMSTGYFEGSKGRKIKK
jgi:hypothetical protein